MTEVMHKSSLSRDSHAQEPRTPVERFERRWREVPAPEAPAGPTPEQNQRYDLSMARQAEIERERWAFTEQRRRYRDLLDDLFALSGDARADFMRLHEKPQGNEACVSVVLRYAFACHLDRVRGEHRRNAQAVSSLGEGASDDLLGQARAALAQAQPDLSLVVEATCFARPSRTEQALARELGLHQCNVGRRKWRGLHWLRDWLQDQLYGPLAPSAAEPAG